MLPPLEDHTSRSVAASGGNGAESAQCLRVRNPKIPRVSMACPSSTRGRKILYDGATLGGAAFTTPANLLLRAAPALKRECLVF